MEKPAFEPTGLVPRSIIRTFDRFRQQLLPEAEVLAVQEFRISRFQLLVSIKCLLTLIFIPIGVSLAGKGLFFKADYRIFLEQSSNRNLFKLISARPSIAGDGRFFRKIVFRIIAWRRKKAIFTLFLHRWNILCKKQFSKKRFNYHSSITMKV